MAIRGISEPYFANGSEGIAASRWGPASVHPPASLIWLETSKSGNSGVVGGLGEEGGHQVSRHQLCVLRPQQGFPSELAYSVRHDFGHVEVTDHRRSR